mgnify:FL=1
MLAAVVCCALLALLCQHLYQKKRRQKLVYESILQELEQRQHTLQQEIDRNQEALDRLQQEKTDQQADQVQQTQHLRQTIDRLKAEKLQLQHQQFRGTRIYKKIHALTRQDTADRKAWKVLSPDERTELRRTVDGIYADYIAHLQTLYSPLTEDDRLYCCRAAAGLDTQTIALCFGYTDTHTINQRKLRLKARYIGPKA